MIFHWNPTWYIMRIRLVDLMVSYLCSVMDTAILTSQDTRKSPCAILYVYHSLRRSLPVKTLRLMAVVGIITASAITSHAQQYRNLSNQRFNTVASGPMQAVVVDIPADGVRQNIDSAIAARLNSVRKSRESELVRESALYQRLLHLKQPPMICMPDIVLLRKGGQIVLPAAKRVIGANDLTFTFPAATESGAWPAAAQQSLVTFINIVYPELKRVYGSPSWSGSVKIINGDATTPIIADKAAISGGFYNASTAEITIRDYNLFQSVAMALTQNMAFAFHGPYTISYEAWERGMARAATMITLGNLVRAGQLTDIDPADPLSHALPTYDLLNQPPLGNDRFYPTSQANSSITGFGGMIIPRLMMSGSAWMKVAIEDPQFFKTFNSLYYSAAAGDAGTVNSISSLRGLARQALTADGTSSVEGLDFTEWYPRQYVLDTSVSPGVKEYAYVQASRATAALDDPALAIVLVYYRTTLDASNISNELPLSGTCYPIYWDYTYTNRLFLGAQYERLDVRNGEGSIVPVFPNTLGGTDTSGRMRITIDLPINYETVRLYTAPRQMGPLETPSTIWGSLIGADTGIVQLDTETGVSVQLPVVQGSFGPIKNPDGTYQNVDAFTRPGRSTLTYTSPTGTKTIRKINTGYNELVPVIYVSDPISERTHLFPAGPQMISFPIRPLQPRAGDALLDPISGSPLFNDGNLLLAQWRQDITAEDKYQRYPTLDPIAPGKGYWSNFAGPANLKLIGRLPAQDQDYTMSLLFGWNQIATPYESDLAVSDLLFQFQADNVAKSTTDAINLGWLGQVVPGVGTVVAFQYDTATGYTPAASLKPWLGYWMRVLVSDGLSLTFPNPVRSRSQGVKNRAVAVTKTDGWATSLVVRGSDGLGATCWLGQSSAAQIGYDSKLDVMAPPAFSRSIPAINFIHTDWGRDAGAYFSDIHPTSSVQPWEITVTVPDPQKSYTVTWPAINKVPRSIRLVLEDTATGIRKYLQGSSGYSFTAGSSSTRRFKILAERRDTSALRILNIDTRQTRGAGAMRIAYQLTGSASVSASIRSADGRVIRHLDNSRAATTGQNELLWDQRDDRSIAVPIGAYLVEINARTPEGESARAVQPVVVVR